MKGRGIDPPAILAKYDTNELLYHVNQCLLSHLLIKGQGRLQVDFPIAGLDPTGHEFLANIRQDTNWNKVKTKLSKIGSYSLSTITTVATSVMSEVVKSQLR